MGERTAVERIAAGEQLVVSTLNPVASHRPRHPKQCGGAVIALCGRTVVWAIPDAPAMRGRGPLPLCTECSRQAPPRRAESNIPDSDDGEAYAPGVRAAAQ